MQCAHLCPRQEIDWFEANGMNSYNLDGSLPQELITNDSSNALTLRSDLHYAFDRCSFVFVPKPIFSPSTASPTASRPFVTHVLEQANEIGPLYHNGTLLPVRGVRTEFLLVRFAWAIFRYVKPFLSHKVERVLLLVKDEAVKPEIVSGDECRFLASNQQRASNSRSSSPRKRRAPDTLCESIEVMGYESDDAGYSSSGSYPFPRNRWSSSSQRSFSSSRSSDPIEGEHPKTWDKIPHLCIDEAVREVESAIDDS
jgi:hypothetical protein